MGAGLVCFNHYHCSNSIHILGKTMSREEIRSTVRTYLAEQLYFDFDTESDDSDLFESGNIDSLGFVTFIGFLQATYGIKFSSTDIRPDAFRSVNAITDLLAVRLTKGESP